VAWIGLAATGVFAAVSLLLVAAEGWNPRLTISLHVARARSAKIVFGLVTLACATTLVWWLWHWLWPRQVVNWFSGALATLALGLVVVAGLVPHTSGLAARIHIKCAQAAAAAAVACAFTLPFAIVHRGPTWLSLVELVFASYAVALATAFRSAVVKRWALYWESAFAIGFLATLAAAGLA
jgi:hypothetical protein